MKKTYWVGLVAGLAILGSAGIASATVMTTDLQDIWDAGGVAVAIPGSEYDSVTAITDPFGGTISLSTTMEHRIVGSSWSTWASTYGDPTGLDILWSLGETAVTLSFAPDLVEDFGFELEPNPFSVVTFTLGLDDGSTLTQDVSGSAGALAFGFTGGGVEWLSIYGQSDFAIGRLSMDVSPVPEPATMLLFGTGIAGLAGSRLRRKKRG